MTAERIRAIEDWRSKGVTMAAAVRVTAHMDVGHEDARPLTRWLAIEDLELSGAQR
jgi:hypothetical protein